MDGGSIGDNARLGQGIAKKKQGYFISDNKPK
jgi:hypothetical protein